MATKNFSQMTTKKLQALIETASDDDKLAIQEILDARAQAETPKQSSAKPVYAEINIDDEEEEAAEEVAEEKPAESHKRKTRATDNERIALATKLRETTLYHKCQVVPFNTNEWADGVIVGIVEDKRSNKVLFAVKLEDGRRVVKTSDSKLIKITDEIVEKVAMRRESAAREKIAKSPWTPEKLEADVAEVAVNVGKMVQFVDGEQAVEGRIVSIVPDKRSQRCLYRIEIPMPTELDPSAVRYAHKVTTLAGLEIAEAFDETGVGLNVKFTERRAKAFKKVTASPELKCIRAKQAYDKAVEAYAKAGDKVNMLKEAFETAKAEYEASLQQMSAVETEVTEESLA